ncbi:MAG: general secretion pathway protein GspB [Gammaproteobacteria bacterium]|nr:general secretion pathway protein GspB [Gammaproteobacteria bacterium]
MSIILDALKKSENERRRQERPGFADLPTATPRAPIPPWVLLGVGALSALLVTLGVAFFFLQGRDVPSPSDTASATAQRDDGARIAAPVDADPWDDEPVRDYALAGPDRSVRSLAREVPATSPPARSSSAPPAGDVAAPPASAPSTAPRSTADTASPASDLPSADELTASGELTIPDLHMDLHVYATDPAQRFVFINGRRLRQGDEISPDLRVHEILADGIVLQQGSTRFILPRD